MTVRLFGSFGRFGQTDGLERKHRQDTGHQVEDQAAEQGQQHGHPKRHWRFADGISLRVARNAFRSEIQLPALTLDARGGELQRLGAGLGQIDAEQPRHRRIADATVFATLKLGNKTHALR